jgi:hypothetical protein
MSILKCVANLLFGVFLFMCSPAFAVEPSTPQNLQPAPTIPQSEWRTVPSTWPKVTTFEHVTSKGVFPDSVEGLAACRQALVDSKYQGVEVPGFVPTDATNRRPGGRFISTRLESPICVRTTSAIQGGSVVIALLRSGTEVSLYQGTVLRGEMTFCGNPYVVLATATVRPLDSTQGTRVTAQAPAQQVTVEATTPQIITQTQVVRVITNYEYEYVSGTTSVRNNLQPQRVIAPTPQVQVVTVPVTHQIQFPEPQCQNGCWGGRQYVNQPIKRCVWPGPDGRLGTADDIVGCVPGHLCAGTVPSAEVLADFERARRASGQY